jgi:SAM-dependent methyltransferase
MSAEQTEWERIMYATGEVYSSECDDEVILERIVRLLPSDLSPSRVLIPGCGPNTGLQRYLLNRFGGLEELVAADFSNAALERANRLFAHSKLRYYLADTCRLEIIPDCYFDLIVSINSLLSPSESTTQSCISELSRVLATSGHLLLVVPSVFCALELATLFPDLARPWVENGWIDILASRLFEPTEGIWKGVFTPNRLKRIVTAAGLSTEYVHLVFLDSDFCRRATERHHGIPAESGVSFWKYVLLLKRLAAPGVSHECG